MTDFKGFGQESKGATPRLIRLHDTSRSEMDRAMNGYIRQGVARDQVTSLVATSVVFCMAREAGMIEGEDYKWQPDGTTLSPRMQEWMQEWVPQQQWEHLKMEGFINTVEIPETEEKVVLTVAGVAKLMLVTAKEPEGTSDNGAAAQRHCVEAMEAAGFSRFDAESKLRRYLNGDDSLEQELLDGIAAGVPILFGREEG